MKKIIILSFDLEIGGVERSLIGLLNAIDYSRYAVDLFLYAHEGEFMDMIPPEVNLLPEIKPYSMFEKPIVEVFRRTCWHVGLVRVLSKLAIFIKSKAIRNVQGSLMSYYCRYSLPFLPRISDIRYDLAISFLEPHHFITKVQAKKTIAWIHTDYSNTSIDEKLERKMWDKFNYIAAVSEDCKKIFVRKFPELENKVLVIENILSPQFVYDQADADVSGEMPDEAGVLKICTVGRFSTAKGFDNAVLMCKKLIDMGCKTRWYAVGYGGDEPLIRAKIKETGMEENFIILGKKTNPYPYIKACDIYVQPSRHEGKAVTVREAQILTKPVVITNCATAQSQLQNGYDGMIVPMDIDNCAKGIAAIIEDEALLEKLISNTKQLDYGNENEVEKIYRLIEEAEIG
ncbi:MAG: glycosyltransferase [Anaerolineaceae bacterium]|nr:glycosyltransferase [Anaerolineaceae bacterium]